MLAYIQLLRPLNCLMSAIAVFIGGLLVTGIGFYSPDFQNIYLAIIAVFLITGAGNAINDYTDLESDRINKPKRPLPSGRISPYSALIFSIILFISGIFLTGFINWLCFIIAIINSIFLVIYSFYLQNKILLGNLVVSYLVGSTFLFGGAVFGNLTLPLLLMILAMFSNFSREIVKDMEDIEGDKKAFLKRLTSGFKASIAERFGITTKGVNIKYKRKWILILAGLSLMVAIIISPIPYLLNILGWSYLILVTITDVVFIFCIYKLSSSTGKKQFSDISKKIKIGMLFGLLAFIIGILI